MRSAASNDVRAGRPVVLDRDELAEVVVELGRIRLVAQAGLELGLRRVEAADDHQGAAEDLVRFGVVQIELQGLRQRLDRVADLLLRELAVAERVPAPRRRGRFFTYSVSSGSASSNLPRGCSLRAAPRARLVAAARRAGRAGAGRWRAGGGGLGALAVVPLVSRVTASVDAVSAGFSSAAFRYAATAPAVSPLALEGRAEQALRFGGLGPQPDGALEPGRGAVVLAASSSPRALPRDRGRCLIAIRGRHELAALGQRGGGLVLLPARASASPS